MEPNTSPANPAALPARIDKEGNIDTTAITTDEARKYADLGRSLVPGDVNSILNYGTEVQGSMEKYSNDFLSSVRTYNSGEVGGMINELLTELNMIDVDELNQGAFKQIISRIPFLNKLIFDAKKLF